MYAILSPVLAESALREKKEKKKKVVYYLAAGIMLFKHSLFPRQSFLVGHSII